MTKLEPAALTPAIGAFVGGCHLFPVRVYYEDTDFSGVVYHANYLRLIERARTEMLRELDIHQSSIHNGDAGEKMIFVVARMNLDFLRPARMDDLLTIETTPVKIGAATIELDQKILRGTEVLFTARVFIAAVAQGRPRRLPVEIRQKLTFGAVDRPPKAAL
jgi:acyl-CoA thioester hydrolase